MSAASVALSLPFKYHTGGSDGLWYSIPIELESQARVGSRVLVPLGARHKTGVIIEVAAEVPPLTGKLRAIADVLDAEPVFDEAFLRWTKWIATYYLTSWGEVLAAALPEGLKPESRARVRALTVADDPRIAELHKSAPRQAQLLGIILGHPGGVSVAHLQKLAKTDAIHSSLRALETSGLIALDREIASGSAVKYESTVALADTPGSQEFRDAMALLERQAPKQTALLLAILDEQRKSTGEPIPVRALLDRAKSLKPTRAQLKSLEEKGLIVLGRREVRARIGKPSDIGADHITNLTLTRHQQIAVHAIGNALEAGKPKTFLLHGVTGSGKTEVYITLARRVLASGGGVLILVPEISLTPQLIDRFRRRLAANAEGDIAVLHSRMSTSDRVAAWHSIASGRTRLAIGARSAVFAPVRDLKLIIVDEEHEATYKQYDKTPRYHARDIAVMRGAMLSAVTVLGSATPSIESAYNAREGKYDLVPMQERAQMARLPDVRVVDLRTAENRRDFARAKSALTPELREAIAQRIARNEATVLLQNRRGYSTYLECIACGAPEMCPNCAITLTYHRAGDKMRCHYCGYSASPRKTCATCGSEALRRGGMGTERVEDDIRKSLPEARILRMDLDTTARKGAYKKILTAFAAGEADILLGTQMVAKGLDFPRVTLVGVVSADTSLCIPDFRSGERTFQLLTQVAGRAGRTMELAGEVLIQTLQPTHPAVALSVTHDYHGFFEQELKDREQLKYPPFSRLVLLEFRGESETLVRSQAERFATLFPEHASFYERIGPAAPAIAKLRGDYRYHIIIKDLKSQDPNGDRLRRLLTGAIEQYQKRFADRKVKLIVDVDAHSLS